MTLFRAPDRPVRATPWGSPIRIRLTATEADGVTPLAGAGAAVFRLAIAASTGAGTLLSVNSAANASLFAVVDADAAVIDIAVPAATYAAALAEGGRYPADLWASRSGGPDEHMASLTLVLRPTVAP